MKNSSFALIAFAISAVLACEQSAVAAGFDGAASADLPELAAGQLKMPPPQNQPPKPDKKLKGKALPSAAAFAPELVSDVSAFALAKEDIAAIEKEVPAPDSPLGRKLAAIMRKVYVGGARPAEFRGSSLRVVSWNINAAHTEKEVAAVLAVADGSADGVAAALGRKKSVSEKSAAQLSKFAQNDVFLIQEIPLPTAIKLADKLGCQVFWAPEFIEVGDNAKGRDPQAGDAYTGNAILSRVPLSDLHVLRFNNQADWYWSQKQTQPLGDKLQKIAAKTLFAADAGADHQTRPPMPYGGRIAMFGRTSARFHAEGVAGKDIWVGNLHLEDLSGVNLTGPELRRAQTQEAAAYIKTIDGPILFGGDLNTMGNNPGVIEGEDIATEAPNLMHVAQPPIDRQHGLAAGVGDKFFGVIDAADLGTTLTHNPGARKGLAVKQSIAVAIDVAPYAPTVHDGINTVGKIKEQPKNIPRDMYYAGMLAADFTPYTAAPAKGFQIFWDERSRHNPTSKANGDHKLFNDVKSELGAQILNPTLGFRFGMGGYPATWSAGRPFMIPGLSKGLANAVTDWLFLRDPDHQLAAQKGEVLKEAVEGTKAGSGDSKKLSDHYPVRAEIALK